MCGRARATVSADDVLNTLHLPSSRFLNRRRYRKAANAYPGGTPLPCLLQVPSSLIDGDRPAEHDVVIAALPCAWGLIPSWTKFTGRDMKFEHFKAFNARAESAASKPMFSRLVNEQRCVVVVDGFYEWKKDDASGLKVPYKIFRKDGKPLLLAALYDVYRGPLPAKEEEKLKALDGEGASGSASAASTNASAGPSSSSASASANGSADVEHSSASKRPITEAYPSVTILTTAPTADLRWLHDRMPVVLDSAEEAERWVNCQRFSWDQLASTATVAPSTSSSSGASHPTAPATATVRNLLHPVEGTLSWFPCDRKMNSLAYQGDDAGLPLASSTASSASSSTSAAALASSSSSSSSALKKAAASHTGPTITSFFAASPQKKKAPAASEQPSGERPPKGGVVNSDGKPPSALEAGDSDDADVVELLSGSSGDEASKDEDASAGAAHAVAGVKRKRAADSAASTGPLMSSSASLKSAGGVKKAKKA